MLLAVEVGVLTPRPNPILRALLRRIVPVRYSDRARGTGTKPFLPYPLFNYLRGRAESDLIGYSARIIRYENRTMKASQWRGRLGARESEREVRHTEVWRLNA